MEYNVEISPYAKFELFEAFNVSKSLAGCWKRFDIRLHLKLFQREEILLLQSGKNVLIHNKMKTNELYIETVIFEENHVVFILNDNRKMGLPYDWLPELKKATDIEREEWEFIGQGEGISWRKFDVDISVDSLFYPTR